jgi:hypothetical protein
MADSQIDRLEAQVVGERVAQPLWSQLAEANQRRIQTPIKASPRTI